MLRRAMHLAKATCIGDAVILTFTDGWIVTRSRRWFEPSPDVAPDFDDLEVIDEGSTLRLGRYEVSSRLLRIYTLEPAVERYAALLYEATVAPWYEMSASEQAEMDAYSERLYQRDGL